LLVDLLVAYSKRVDLISELVSASERLKTVNGHEAEVGHSVRSERSVRAWRISDRLTETELGELICNFQRGKPVRELVAQYKITKSSGKPLLRQQGIRRATP
jgi:hypothetical protein